VKRIIVLYLFIFFAESFFAQIATSQVATSKYWIRFTDKIGTPYSISNPSEYLSAKAITRRNNQHISISENDLPVNPSYIDSVVNIGVTLLNKSRWFNAITIYTTDTNKLKKINLLPFVSGTKPVGISRKKNDVETVQSFSAKTTTSNDYAYGGAYNQINMVNGICLHDLGYDGKGMTIAVIDAGFYQANILPAFDSIRLNNRILGTWDFVLGIGNVYSDPAQDDPHGSEVLSVMASYLPGQIIGTAPKAKYWLFRSEDSNSEKIIEEDNWVSAAEVSDSVGADVINTSLGYNTFDDPSQNHTYADLNGHTTVISIAASIAASKGMIVVCAAGNEGGDSWGYITVPADADSILAVGAVDMNKNYAPFSSIGPSSDGRIKPDVAALGAGTAITDFGNGVSYGSGTSFASPVIAGMVACLWQAHPELKNMDIINAVKQSASRYSDPNDSIGYGIPNFCVANILLSGTNPPSFQEDHLYNIFPNPFITSFGFSFYSSINQTLKIELFDITGREIWYTEKQMNGTSYNTYTINELATLSTGMYFLTVTSDNKKYAEKLIKE